MSNFQWWRKWLGGDWYLNRYWTSTGQTTFSRWGRKKLSSASGPQFTVGEEHY